MESILITDTMIEDRTGKLFSLWVIFVSGKVFRIQYTNTQRGDIKEVTFDLPREVLS